MTEVLGPGEGAARYVARGSVMHFKALADRTAATSHSWSARCRPGGGDPDAPPRRLSEAYFVLEGTVSVVVDGDELRLGREDFVLVPRGVSHTFGNGGEEEARLLVLHAPALDDYFAGLHELWNRHRPPTPDEERALMASFGMVAGDA